MRSERHARSPSPRMRAVGHASASTPAARAISRSCEVSPIISAAVRHRELRHQLQQHRRVRLRRGLVGAARSANRAFRPWTRARGRARAGSCRSRWRAGARRKGPSSSRMPANSCIESSRARKCCGSSRRTPGTRLGRQLRHHDAQRVVQAEADDVARALALGHREAEVAARSWMHSTIVDRRIDDRAVPVEHEQAVFHGSVRHATFIVGRQRRLEPHRLAGQRMAKRELAAQEHAPPRAPAPCSAKSPYLSSPRIGCPACARCTRIWCVRPVRSSHFEQAELRGFLAGLHPVDGGHAALVPTAHPPLARAGHVLVQRLAQLRRLFVAPAPLTTRGRASRPRPRAACGAARPARCASCTGCSSPEVSRSSRCASSRNLRLRPRRAQRLDHPEADAAAAVHRHAGGLVDHEDRPRPRTRPGDRCRARGRRASCPTCGPAEPGSGRRPAAGNRASPGRCSPAPRRCGARGRRGFSARPSARATGSCRCAAPRSFADFDPRRLEPPRLA